MTLVIPFFWLLLTIGIFLSFFAAAYYAYIRDASATELILKLIAAIVVHTVVSIPGGFFSGILMFVQAHSEGMVSIGWKELTIAGLFLGLEAMIGWLLCSAIVDRLIGLERSV